MLIEYFEKCFSINKMSMPPLISILIPAFNAQAWIADTIRSALAQTCPRKEIIIVDDGSTDDTLDVARQFESSTVKVIHQENRGACRARNVAFGKCQGDYIQWIDADDLLAKDKIERQLYVADTITDPYILLTSAWGRFYCRPEKTKFRPNPLWRDLDAVEWLVLRLANPWWMHPSSWLVSRQLTEKAGPWEEKLARDQDGEYFCRIVSLSQHVKFVSDARCYYRMANFSSVSNSTSRNALESICLSIDLSISHVLAREDSERTRKACISRLNIEASLMEYKAPDLADRFRNRIAELGGEVVSQNTSRKYALIKKLIGERNARRLKNKEWRIRQNIYRSSDRWLAKLFGTNF